MLFELVRKEKRFALQGFSVMIACDHYTPLFRFWQIKGDRRENAPCRKTVLQTARRKTYLILKIRAMRKVSFFSSRDKMIFWFLVRVARYLFCR